MNATVADAVQALNLAVVGLLPPAASPELTPDVLVNPVKTHPAGIGGFIGLNQAPMGEIHARRLKAQVVIRVKADSIAGLNSTESAVTNALIGADTTHLRSQGIFRITRDTGFSQLYQGADDGINVAAGKDIRFDVDFEYQRLPDTADGVISSVPLDLLLHTTDNPPRELFDQAFDEDPLALFDIIDDAPVTDGPGNWSHNAADSQLEQTSGISGGSNAFNASKRGTYLVLRPSSVATQPQNWLLHAEIGADGGGIGLVFNFVDVDNFHFFIMSQPTPYRFIGRKSDGNFSFLDQGGQDNGNAYAPGEHSIRLIQQNGEFELAIDQIPVISGSDDTPPAAGSIGFLSRNSATARFRSLRWVAL